MEKWVGERQPDEPDGDGHVVGEGLAAVHGVMPRRLVGRLSAGTRCVLLATGLEVVSFELTPAGGAPRPQALVGLGELACVVWAPGLRRRALRWGAGDRVEVTGVVRRRFYRDRDGRTRSARELDVLTGRIARQASS